MKAPFSIALLAIVCCMPVLACATPSAQATDTVTTSRAAGEDVPGGTIEDRL